MPSERRVAVDTTVVVNLLTAGTGDEDASRLPHSAWVFRAAQAGIHRLVVPALVLAEVAGSGKVRGSQLPSGERRRRVARATSWLSEGRFVVADIDDRVARHAADLAVQHQLKGADACIVAVAQLSRCSTLYSWDDDHTKLDGVLPRLAVVNLREQALQQMTIEPGA